MSAHNWGEIERAYGAGEASIREIARRHAIPESTIRLRAKASGWQRAAPPDKAARPDGRQSMLDRHRRDIGRLNALQEELAQKARAMVEAAGTLRELADAAAAIERLGRITDRLITLERQACDVGAPGKPGSGIAEALKKARRRAQAADAPPTATESESHG